MGFPYGRGISNWRNNQTDRIPQEDVEYIFLSIFEQTADMHARRVHAPMDEPWACVALENTTTDGHVKG